MENYMDIALEEAYKAKGKGEIPVGAVIVKDNQVIARTHNLKETLKNPVSHAEILAINEACNAVGDWRLTGCEMYVTLEPCPMCASAISHSRLSKVHIGTFNPDTGACGSVVNLLDYPLFNHHVKIEWCYDERCSKIITDFFEERRTENRINRNSLDRRNKVGV